MKILADASLPSLEHWFKPPCCLTLYHEENKLTDLLKDNEVLLCRSTLKVTENLLAHSALRFVATASSGIDHIDADYLKSHHITLLDAKGCNARAVADYVLACVAFLHSKQLLIGKKAGVIGVGEVGSRVVKRLQAAGFEVICYDPLKAKMNHHFRYCGMEDLLTCDVLCVHANLHHTAPYPSANLLSTDFLTQLKPGTTLINAARGGIVDEAALLKLTQPLTYCTDVYQGEPSIHEEIVDFSMLCTPHIAGHTIEAKQTAVQKISQQLHRHYEYEAPLLPPSTLLDNRIAHNSALSWSDLVLCLYHPLHETQALKSATDKKHAFLSHRKAHQRHEFSKFAASLSFVNSDILLGSV